MTFFFRKSDIYLETLGTSCIGFNASDKYLHSPLSTRIHALKRLFIVEFIQVPIWLQVHSKKIGFFPKPLKKLPNVLKCRKNQ